MLKVVDPHIHLWDLWTRIYPHFEKPGKGGAKPAADARQVALGMIHNGLEQLRHAVGDDEDVLSIVGDLTDLLGQIEDALGVSSTDDDQVEGLARGGRGDHRPGAGAGPRCPGPDRPAVAAPTRR